MKTSLYQATLLLAIVLTDAVVTQAQQLTEANYDQRVPQGKEVDAIYGDFAIGNETAKAVIAAPMGTRNANMTVRGVGGCLLDLAAAKFESDQLSAFYPGRRQFPLTAATFKDGAVTMTSPGSDKRPKCEVTYRMVSGQPIVNVTSVWTNSTPQDWTLSLEDDLRADGGKEDMVKSPNGTHELFYFHDIFWQQAYGVRADGYSIRTNSNSRECVLTYEPADGQPIVIKPGESFTFSRHVIVGKDQAEVMATGDQLAGRPRCQTVQLSIDDSSQVNVAGVRIEIGSAAGSRGTVVADNTGVAMTRLPPGKYTLNYTVDGSPVTSSSHSTLTVKENDRQTLLDHQPTLHRGRISASIRDGEGQAIPAKVEFKGTDGTPTPDWGPDSAEHFVRNLAYTADGTFDIPLRAGTYDVIVSHGPEHDAVFTKLVVEAGKTADLNASLKRSVRTPGWVSSDFHSHSSPSGDNTGSQLGRVLNLAAEQIDFAPCTEHNRVSTYEHHIAKLGLGPFMATVSGMELTGQPLPLNHQNVFPMQYAPRTQDGGGPVTDTSPETQIERIALWDDRSEKLIQQNHPDLGWLFYDKNGDGTPDEGYSRSFPLMDVMEIHPIDRILTRDRFDIRNGNAFNNNRMLNWLQLLNQGFRIYGVVNTDAHYNFHGSGGLRNWIQSSTDDPAKIDHMEMVHASEQGRLIMSNGPYLEATFSATDRAEPVVSGQDMVVTDGKVNLHVRVQCPNWFDIDTVFVLVNGKVADGLHFTRSDNADMFDDDVVKFDQQLSVPVQEDSHIVVVTGHRTEVLGDVLGPDWGTQHPAALTNPVFVDVDGDGFQPNKDTLGFPLPMKFKK